MKPLCWAFLAVLSVSSASLAQTVQKPKEKSNGAAAASASQPAGGAPAATAPVPAGGVPATTAPKPTDTASESWKFTADQTILRAGQQYKVIVELTGDKCNERIGTLGTVTSGSSADLIIGTPVPVGADSPCKRLIDVTVKDDASSGKQSLIFNGTKESKNGILGLLAVTIQNLKPIPPGPTIPGVEKGVDIMWKVLPRQSVADSYGDRVADGFFAVEATLGNNTGYDLQIAALGFEVPDYECKTSQSGQASTKSPCTSKTFADDEDHKGFLSAKQRTLDKPTIPVDAYPIVRGTVEREQFVGTRAIIVNLVRGSGSVLVGVGNAYFNGTGGLFNPAASIFSTTFEKGLELVYPDLTTNHLIALDNRTLRDGVTIPNNAPIRVNAFISRELVQCGHKRRGINLFSRNSRFNFYCEIDDTRLMYERNFDPTEIMEHLGKIVLIGQQVQYLNRIRIVANSNGDQTPIGPVITNTGRAMRDTEKQPLRFTGTNLTGATVHSNEPGLIFSDYNYGTDGTSLDFSVTISDNVAKAKIDSYPIVIDTRYGKTPASFDLPPLEEPKPSPAVSPED